MGVIASFLTAITASRIMCYLLISTGLKNKPSLLGITTKSQPKSWNIVGLRNVWFAISGLLLVVGIVSMVTQGMNWGLDFAGGNLVEVKTSQTLTLPDIEQYATGAGMTNVSIQPGDQAFVLKGKEIAKENVTALVGNLKSAGITAEVQRQEFVGPTIGKELREKAILAVLIALIGQIIYVSIRFEWKFAIAAVGALFHDVLILVGMFSLFGREVDSTFLAALLTIIGYSVNDTVVIFDRIRENRKRMKGTAFTEIVNASVNQTMARSLNTGASVILMLFVLLIMGGATLNNFALALFVGVILGTYSSIFNAGPIVAIWHKDASASKGALTASKVKA
jgi:preprotein translocase SecF subunit